MKLKTHHNAAAVLPLTEGHIWLLNHYEAEVSIPVSSVRHIQNNGLQKNEHWKDVESRIIIFYARPYTGDYYVRTDINTLLQIIKLARLGFDIDLRPYSGRKAQPLKNIFPLLEKLPEKTLKSVQAGLNKPTL